MAINKNSFSEKIIARHLASIVSYRSKQRKIPFGLRLKTKIIRKCLNPCNRTLKKCKTPRTINFFWPKVKTK